MLLCGQPVLLRKLKRISLTRPRHNRNKEGCKAKLRHRTLAWHTSDSLVSVPRTKKVLQSQRVKGMLNVYTRERNEEQETGLLK